jgi:hypothetical protein
VAVDPYIVLGAVPTVEQIAPPLGMVIVPVGLEGIGLTPGAAISVEPSGIPVCEIGAPMVPSGVVALTEGVGAAMPVTWAKAVFTANSEQNAAAIIEDFTALSCCRTVVCKSNSRVGPALAASHGNSGTAGSSNQAASEDLERNRRAGGRGLSVVGLGPAHSSARGRLLC